MDVQEVDNDTRGWILSTVSGIACVLGASVICVDIIVRQFPGKKNFRIQDSNAFLASSLSLSFGVMIFMSLYSMLPEAKLYLKKGEFSDSAAGLVLIGCFVSGFVGIQAISRLCHQLLPSHVVDCDHSHGELHKDEHVHSSRISRRHSSHPGSTHENHHSDHSHGNGHATEATPLLVSENGNGHAQVNGTLEAEADDLAAQLRTQRPGRSRGVTVERKPSMVQVQKRVMSFVKDTKANCDETGPCYGYSDPCGQECFKHLSSRSNLPISRAPTLMRTTTGTLHRVFEGQDTVPSTRRTSRVRSHDPCMDHERPDDEQEMNDCDSEHSEDVEAQHHHHVAENAFLSIGLQTTIAIALHKFPEGFITYATNHANPGLGFNVFLALFVHNISEGFAMALPLYMALNNRLKAMLWSSLLGGLSQPFGAGIAALWFKLARRTHLTPNSVAYGCLFGVTAGIMASVALQLFVESLSMNHNRNLSIAFAFLGMTLLGLSSAFTSEH
ncbi:ZIP zinc transporter-domain-containing protein [Xylariales sp. PMI_506]|nr:ZIP zinc transporter-domain-containing protein [Xylariales sp. PMI_506]